ncbi:MAG: alkyl hydroperoxide reductase [Marinilabiliales bacterium]|nr:MAG: alkyl hydroperoxide reductase [Marinilabiliales bacterium]
MKKLLFVTLAFMLTNIIWAQDIPSVQIKDLNNKNILSKDLFKGENMVILSFWATWCKPCIKELDAYNENIEEWAEETGVELIAISVDNTRSMSRVAPFVNGRGWENIQFYLDPNEDFKRAMNVVNIPHTLLLDREGNILWQHNSYTEGDEYELYDVIKEQTK